MKPQSCSEYLALPAAKRQELFGGDKPVRIYEASGVRSGTTIEAYDAFCDPASGNDDPDLDLSNALDWGLAMPTCGRYKKLNANAKKSWLEAVAQEEYFPADEVEATTAVFDMACQGFGPDGDSLVDVANRIRSAVGFTSWKTVTKSGQKTGFGIEVFPVQTGDNVEHPQDRSLTLDDTCDYNSVTDAAVPFTVWAIDHSGNDKSGRSLAVAYTLLFKGNSDKATTTGAVEAHYSSRSVCYPAQSGSMSNQDAIAQVQWDASENDWGRSKAFVIIRNWVSPSDPEGAKGELADYVLHGVPHQADADDPIVESTQAGIDLSGARAGS